MSHSVRRHLHLEIDEYDEIIRQFIPGYDQMLEQVARAVALSGPGRVLDLGAGTGALSEAILQKCGETVSSSWSTSTTKCWLAPGRGCNASANGYS